jgi:hypothetical protein
MPPKKVENTVEKKVVKRVSKKSDKDPNEPKKNKSAYMFYCGEGRGEIKQENPDLDNKSVVIELGVRWTKIKESNPDKLKYYNDLAEQDKKRYQEEKGNYVKPSKVDNEDGEVEKKTKKKTEKVSSSDTEEPKKKTKVNGYINYCTVNREQCKLDNPGLLPKDITKKLSEGWKSLSDEEKEKFKY